jgi:hypothetical protein
MLTNSSGVASHRTLVRCLGVATGPAALLVTGPSKPVLDATAAELPSSAVPAVRDRAVVVAGADAVVTGSFVDVALVDPGSAAVRARTGSGATWPGEPWQ